MLIKVQIRSIFEPKNFTK